MSQPAPSQTHKLNQQVVLRDGRRLGFAEYGASGGTPLLYFHGWPSSRLEARALENVASGLGFHVVAPDRPGYGLSDFKPERAIADWVEDVRVLAAHLGWERFSILGISGGGPYAAACAARIPEMLRTVLLVCSMGPTDHPEAIQGMVPVNRWLLTFAHTTPWLAQRLASVCLRTLWGTGDQVIPEQIEACLPERDRRTLSNRQLRLLLTEASREGLRRDVDGAAWEGFLYSQPWGFRLENIRVPVFLWHGEEDNIVPASMGHYLAQRIPGCQAVFYPEDGHFSLPFTRMEEILRHAL
jgi:pimeloyl-ACP methyl ester carboxylesterase